MYVHTCPQRAGFRVQTLESVAASDIGKSFTMICHAPGLTKQQILQWWEGELLRLCDEAEREGQKYLLRIEDDVVVNRYILHNVCSWPALVEPKFGMGTLFLWDLLERDVGCLARSPFTNSLYRHKHECPGSQCQLIPVALLKLIVPEFSAMRERYWRLARGFAMDGAPSAALWHRGFRVYIHEPSLVDCHDRGMASAQGLVPKAPLVASSFDAEWRRA